MGSICEMNRLMDKNYFIFCKSHKDEELGANKVAPSSSSYIFSMCLKPGIMQKGENTALSLKNSWGEAECGLWIDLVWRCFWHAWSANHS